MLQHSLSTCLLTCLLWWLVPADAGEPCREFVIAIDVGHSRNKPGAISARGVEEFYFNAQLARVLFETLHATGFKQVFMINAKGADMALADRAKTAGRKQAELFISIHHDSVQEFYLRDWSYKGKSHFYSDRFQGYSIFYSEKNPQSRKSLAFAKRLGQELLRSGLTPSLHHAEKIPGENRELVDAEKGIYRFDDLIVLKETTMPAVLLEAGIILHRDEEVRLSDSGYQKTLALSVTRAVAAFCENR